MSSTRSLRVFAVLPAVAVVLATSPAWAAPLTYTAQTRAVSAKAYTGTNQSASAPDFAAFDGTATSTGTTPGNTATSRQQSQLLPTRITFDSEMSGTRTTQSTADNINGGAGLTATFTLDASSPYDFDIFARGAPNTFNAFCSATLTDLANNSTVFTSIFPVPGTLPGTSSFRTGTLAAGSYRLQISHTNGTSTGSLGFGSSYSAAFVVPEPASMGLVAAGIALLGRRRRAG